MHSVTVLFYVKNKSNKSVTQPTATKCKNPKPESTLRLIRHGNSKLDIVVSIQKKDRRQTCSSSLHVLSSSSDSSSLTWWFLFFFTSLSSLRYQSLSNLPIDALGKIFLLEPNCIISTFPSRTGRDVLATALKKER